MPQTTPWTRPLRGTRDGVNDKHAKNNAPQQPGRVKSRHLGTRLRDGILGAAVGEAVGEAVGGALGAGTRPRRAVRTDWSAPISAPFGIWSPPSSRLGRHWLPGPGDLRLSAPDVPEQTVFWGTSPSGLTRMRGPRRER